MRPVRLVQRLQFGIVQLDLERGYVVVQMARLARAEYGAVMPGCCATQANAIRAFDTPRWRATSVMRFTMSKSDGWQ